MLFILVWRAILGPSDLLLCRERRMEVKFALSPRPMPKGPPSTPSPKCGMGPLAKPNEKREGLWRAEDLGLFTVFTILPEFGSERGLL